MGLFVAHTPPDGSAVAAHDLREHLEAVATGTARRLTGGPLMATGELVGLLHDIGKAKPAFQAYLKSGRKRSDVDHKSVGAFYLLGGDGVLDGILAASGDPRTWSADIDPQVRSLLAGICWGHHGGLVRAGLPGDPVRSARPSAARLHDELAARVAAAGESAQRTACATFAAALVPGALLSRALDECVWLASENVLSREALARQVFAALTDADQSDTADYYAHALTPGGAARPDGLPSLKEACAHLDRVLGEFDENAPSSALNTQRKAMRDEATRRASTATGPWMTLNAPTGAGKTITAFAVAANVARGDEVKKIVICVPFLSVTEQVADEARRFFGKDAVFEHHSAVEHDDGDDLDSYRRFTERWDHPVIVTTTARLIETLGANKPSRARRLHHLAGSVIVIDEPQSLPRRLLSTVTDLLDELCVHSSSRVLLTSATPVPVEKVRGLTRTITPVDLVPSFPQLRAGMRRARIRVLGGEHTVDDAAAWMAASSSALCIVNTRRSAAELHARLAGLGDPGVAARHLSTSMCQLHRRRVLADVRARLTAGDPVHLVSTQLIEAGVDVDFPVVFRTRAPLDSIVQAAGRCNREGRRPLAASLVTVFSLDEFDHLPAYTDGIALTDGLIAAHPGVPLDDLVDQYLAAYVTSRDTGVSVQDARRDLDYPTVAREMTLVDQDTATILCAYDASTADLIAWCDIADDPARAARERRDAAGELRARSVSVLASKVPSLAASLSRHGNPERGRLIWTDDYDPDTGIMSAGSAVIV